MTTESKLYKALAYVIRDLEIRADLKLDESQRGIVEIGNGAYFQAKEALQQAEKLLAREDLLPTPGEGFGLAVTQEPKYTVNAEGRLINRATGIAIPDDEPVFILRAKDAKAYRALDAYLQFVGRTHAVTVEKRLNQFIDFSTNNADRMKEPDTEEGAR